MKTTNIKGKEYIEVHERVKYFWENYPSGAIVTEMTSNNNGVCIIYTKVFVDNELKATGYAYETEGSSFINKTSYIENCETSSVGRALGNFGIGIDTSVASAEEVQNAILNQEKKPEGNKNQKSMKPLMTQEQVQKVQALASEVEPFDCTPEQKDETVKKVAALLGVSTQNTTKEQFDIIWKQAEESSFEDIHKAFEPEGG